jgi:hypothetical protein
MILDVLENTDLAVAVGPPPEDPIQDSIQDSIQDPIQDPCTICSWGLVVFVTTGVCTVLMFVFFVVLVVRVLT